MQVPVSRAALRERVSDTETVAGEGRNERIEVDAASRGRRKRQTGLDVLIESVRARRAG